MSAAEQYTEWFNHGSFGVRRYRICARNESGVWVSNHEYEMDDGKLEIGEGRPTVARWWE